MLSKSFKYSYIILFLVGIFPFLINGYINSLIFNNALLYWSFEILSWIVIPTIIFYFAVSKNGLRFSELGLHTKVFGRQSIGLLVAACVLVSFIDYWAYKNLFDYFSSIFTNKAFFSYESIIPSDGTMKIIIAIYFGLSAGIVEELYFRGLLYKISHFFASPNLLYLALSPFLFSIIHWEGGLANVSATFVIGLIMALLFLWLRNLIPLIVGHCMTDLVWFS